MLSYTNFELAYPTSTLSQTVVDRWLNIYKRQLSNYFRFDNTSKSEFIEIDFCGQGKVFLNKPLILDSLYPITIEEFSKKTRVLNTLSDTTDFLYRTDRLDNQEYVYALDFGCIGCLCKCEMIKVTGVFGLLLPDEIEREIYSLIETKSQVLTVDACQQIASEKIGEYQVTYRDTTIKTNSLDINNVYSITQLNQILLLIQTHFVYA
jgi:hypothetical protein